MCSSHCNLQLRQHILMSFYFHFCVYVFISQQEQNAEETRTKPQTRHGDVQVYKLSQDNGSYSLTKTAVHGVCNIILMNYNHLFLFPHLIVLLNLYKYPCNTVDYYILLYYIFYCGNIELQTPNF